MQAARQSDFGRLCPRFSRCSARRCRAAGFWSDQYSVLPARRTPSEAAVLAVILTDADGGRFRPPAGAGGDNAGKSIHSGSSKRQFPVLRVLLGAQCRSRLPVRTAGRGSPANPNTPAAAFAAPSARKCSVSPPTLLLPRQRRTSSNSRRRLPVTGHRSGIRPGTNDSKPYLGRHPLEPRLAIFNGLGSKGSIYAPPLSQQLADHLVKEKEIDPEVDIRRRLKFLDGPLTLPR